MWRLAELRIAGMVESGKWVLGRREGRDLIGLPVACGGMEKGLLSAVVVSEGGYEDGADGDEDLS